jgi:hypothetical protein
MVDLNQAVLASAKKEYKDFEKIVASEVEERMKSTLGGFTEYLVKNHFKKED